MPKSRQSKFGKIKVKLYLQAFWQNMENGKKLVYCLQDLKKSYPKLLNRILRYNSPWLYPLISADLLRVSYQTNKISSH